MKLPLAARCRRCDSFPPRTTALTLAVKLLIESDQEIDLFARARSFCPPPEPHFKRVPPRVVQYYVLKPVLSECALLSALAHVGR